MSMSERSHKRAQHIHQPPRLEVFIFDEDLGQRFIVLRLVLSNGTVHLKYWNAPLGIMDTGQFSIIMAEITDSFIREILDPGGVQLALF